MDDEEREFLRTIAGRRAQSRSSPALNRIARALDCPVEAFDAPELRRGAAWETEQLLVLVGLHLRQLDPGARTRFEEAVHAMVAPESAEGGPCPAEKARWGP